MTDGFLAMFEALRMPAVFARGRRDARAGHVRSLTIGGSLAVAQVRGPDESVSARARIAVRAFGAAEWARVEDDLAGQAGYVADLLAGRMPADVDTVFAAAGLHLLPLSIGEIAMDCTCGLPAPCAHLAALVYALVESFRTDPFGMFAWRGRGRDELLIRLRELRGAVAVAAPPGGSADSGDLGEAAAFWGGDERAGPVWEPPEVGRPDALLDQLDPPAIGGAGRSLADILRPAYRALS